MEQSEVASRRDATGGIFDRLLDFLNRLDEAHIFYVLGHTRPDSVMVDIALRWQPAARADGSVDVERYESVAGVQNDPDLLETLFASADPS